MDANKLGCRSLCIIIFLFLFFILYCVIFVFFVTFYFLSDWEVSAWANWQSEEESLISRKSFDGSSLIISCGLIWMFALSVKTNKSQWKQQLCFFSFHLKYLTPANEGTKSTEGQKTWDINGGFKEAPVVSKHNRNNNLNNIYYYCWCCYWFQPGKINDCMWLLIKAKTQFSKEISV